MSIRTWSQFIKVHLFISEHLACLSVGILPLSLSVWVQMHLLCFFSLRASNHTNAQICILLCSRALHPLWQRFMVVASTARVSAPTSSSSPRAHTNTRTQAHATQLVFVYFVWSANAWRYLLLCGNLCISISIEYIKCQHNGCTFKCLHQVLAVLCCVPACDCEWRIVRTRQSMHTITVTYVLVSFRSQQENWMACIPHS